MKRILWLMGVVLLSGVASYAGTDTNAQPVKVGVYDSRAVAFAYFTSSPYQTGLKKQITTAQAARSSGDTNQFNALAASLRDTQDDMHRQVFSIAPATEAMAALKDRLPAIEKNAGVVDVISKWDEAALQGYKNTEQVDVTDTLVHEFMAPTEKQWKTIESIKTAKPISLDECNELIRKGQL